jgi:hypothetical protein
MAMSRVGQARTAVPDAMAVSRAGQARTAAPDAMVAPIVLQPPHPSPWLRQSSSSHLTCRHGRTDRASATVPTPAVLADRASAAAPTHAAPTD